MKVNINKAHELLGHMNEYANRVVAKALGWKIMRGPMKPCEACSIRRSKQKNDKKDIYHEPMNISQYVKCEM